jgi:hypothetical protein
MQESLAAAKAVKREGEAAESGGEASVAVLHPSQISLPEVSHRGCVTDLRWLPHVTLTRDGRLSAVCPKSPSLFSLGYTLLHIPTSHVQGPVPLLQNIPGCCLRVV